MNRKQLEQILTEVKNKQLSIDSAAKQIAATAIHSSDVANLDLHRELRTGAPEAVFCLGKSIDHCRKISEQYLELQQKALFTRCDVKQAQAITEVLGYSAHHHPDANCVVYHPPAEDESKLQGDVVVVCAGTSDLAVANEAILSLNWLGYKAELIADVGVAGLHRILDKSVRIRTADCAIVVAGMEGALSSVVAGLVDCPVIAVPTSIGYGASFEGLSALLAMLNSCSPGVAVVNIDNGFGAAMIASRIVTSE